MKTINKMRQLPISSDELLSSLTDQSSSGFVNKKIIGALMIGVKSDIDALHFCDTVEKLADNNSLTTHIEILRNGKYCTYKCDLK